MLALTFLPSVRDSTIPCEHRVRDRDRDRDRETEKQRDTETERQRDRETERQRDRETERQRQMSVQDTNESPTRGWLLICSTGTHSTCTKTQPPPFCQFASSEEPYRRLKRQSTHPLFAWKSVQTLCRSRRSLVDARLKGHVPVIAQAVHGKVA